MGNSTTLNLNYVNFLENGRTYNVRIRAKGVINSEYGESCFISENNIFNGKEYLTPNKKTLEMTNLPNYQKVIYPNPFNNILNLDFQNNFIYAELYDTNGNSILHITFENSTSVDLSKLSAGVYFLKTTNMNNEVIIHKLVKN